jgi:hypothetical protein
MAVGKKLRQSNAPTIRKNKDGVKCRLNLLNYLETVALRNVRIIL